MPIEFREHRHVGKVSATLDLLCLEIPPEEITEALGIKPTSAQMNHQPAVFSPQGLQGGMDTTWWSYDSSSQVSSTNVNEHLRHLIALFLPLKSRIEELNGRKFVRVRVHWESTFAGDIGPHIEAACVSALGTMGASLDVNVYKIDELKDA